jgi:hypothetical protein
VTLIGFAVRIAAQAGKESCMPKFMTYQRPTPVNTAAWGGKAGHSPYQPVRRQPASKPSPERIELIRPGNLKR